MMIVYLHESLANPKYVATSRGHANHLTPNAVAYVQPKNPSSDNEIVSLSITMLDLSRDKQTMLCYS